MTAIAATNFEKLLFEHKLVYVVLAMHNAFVVFGFSKIKKRNASKRTSYGKSVAMW